MKVLFDYQIVLAQEYGGISRYYYELLKCFNNNKNIDAKMVALFSRNGYFEDYFHCKRDKSFRLYSKKVKLNELVTKCLVKFGKYDIVQPTYFSPYLLDNKHGKIVLTVYDMIYEIFPELFGEDGKEVIANKAKLIRSADHIIAISESTKRDIIRFYPEIPEDKISVIYIGNSMKPTNDCCLDNGLPERYVLFVGRRNGYKNYKGFSEAMSKLLEEDDNLYALCFGGSPLTEAELEIFGNNKDRVIQMSGSDEMLEYVYSNALCFVFPSKYEGFGIPTLEAFSCRCPVVLSNTSSMPEVGGEAVEYFNPDVDGELERAIRNVIYNESYREELVVKGIQQLSKFNWEDISKQVISCYEKVLQS